MSKCRICKQVKPDPMKPTCREYSCMVEWAKRHADKAKIKRNKEYDRETRKRKQKIKTRSEWLSEAQVEFNKFIRLRDKGLPCVSCGAIPDNSGLITGSRIDCGHYRSRGANPELRFEELNCAVQCVRCNRELSGNVVNFRIELEKRIGKEKLAWVEGPHEPLNLSIEDIKAIKKKYRDKCKEIS